MLLLIDNFDSFTFNIVHAFQLLGEKVHVVRNHQLNVDECLALNPSYLIIGPGPGDPSGAGISKECIVRMQKRFPILGICLGHQAIGEVFGGKTIRAKLPMHGKQTPIFHENSGIFKDAPQGFLATRYNSLVIDPDRFPKVLEITARTSTGEIMGIKHKTLPIEGVQFHPESIATDYGMELLRKFLLS